MNAIFEHDDRLGSVHAPGSEPFVEAMLSRHLNRRLHAPALRDGLLATVGEYTELLRGHGDRVEQVIIRLKDVLRRAPLESAHQSGHPYDAALIDEVVSDAVRHCIEHYYDGNDSSNRSENDDGQ